MERSSRDWIWRKGDEEFHPDYIDYKKRSTGTGMMVCEAFRWGSGTFFELEPGTTVNSTVYRNKILQKSLKEFREESFWDVEEPIVMEDHAPAHKKVCIPIRNGLRMKCLSPFTPPPIPQISTP